MMVKEAKKVEKYAEKELKFILREELIIPDLKKAVEKQDLTKARKLANRISYFERRLNRYHKRLIENIEDLEEIVPAGDKGKLDDLKNKLNVYANDILKEFSRRKGDIPKELKKDEPDWKNVLDDVNKADEELKGWIVLEKQLLGLDKQISEKEVYKYPTNPAASKEKIMDLLKGKGDYAAYSNEQRRDIWNRWQKVSTQKVLKDVNLEKADLQGFDFGGFVFKGKTNLRGANLSGANLSGANLSGANLSGANLSGANLRRANLEKADLQRANLYRADLRKADLAIANLEEVNLAVANLAVADLRDSLLNGAKLNGANLYGAHLARASLFRANLVGAYLVGADLTRADLGKADLGIANLEGANLVWASLYGAKNLTAGQLQKAKNWDKARDIPPGILEELKRKAA